MQCITRKRFGWCGACYVAIKSGGRSSCVAADADKAYYRRLCLRRAEFMKRASEERRAADLDLGQSGCLGPCPLLRDYLCDGMWDDGTQRDTATLLFFWEDGRMKVCLNDRANSRSLWAAGASVETCLAALETMLSTGSAEWRASRGRGAQGKEKTPF